MKSQVIDLSVGVFVWGLMLLIFSVPCFAEEDVQSNASEDIKSEVVESIRSYKEQIKELRTDQIEISDRISEVLKINKFLKEAKKILDAAYEAGELPDDYDYKGTSERIDTSLAKYELLLAGLQILFDAKENRIMILEILNKVDKSLIEPTTGYSGTIDTGFKKEIIELDTDGETKTLRE